MNTALHHRDHASANDFLFCFHVTAEQRMISFAPAIFRPSKRLPTMLACIRLLPTMSFCIFPVSGNKWFPTTLACITPLWTMSYFMSAERPCSGKWFSTLFSRIRFLWTMNYFMHLQGFCIRKRFAALLECTLYKVSLHYEFFHAYWNLLLA